ncbi:MAG: putative Ferritin [Ramlibacter sp.]|jgi:hypothetical protein|nr:putative Ferritin [Ramlibacter sp.]
MKKQFLNSLCAGLLAAGLVACGGGDSAAPVMTVGANGAATIDVATLNTAVASYPLAALSPTEAASLAFMREEEQLAHDVYAVSTTLWPQPIFANITVSEATHSAAIKVLLDRYQQPDPLAGLPNGTFKSPAFQALYDSYVAASRVSLIEALTVGVEIEELDIRDITAQKAGIDNADILMVYDNLLSASRSHLAAFMKVLTQQGGTYVPKYITQAEFDAIVNR